MKGRGLPVVWTSVAERDLAEIVSYLHRESPSAAPKVLDRIEEHASSLDLLPHRGPDRARAGSVGGPDLPRADHPHRLIYSVQPDRVLVLAVLDSRRDLEDLLLRRLLGQ